MSDAPEALPEADRNGDLPHPRSVSVLFGQEAAEAAFLEAAHAGLFALQFGHHYSLTRLVQTNPGAID